MRSFAFIEDLGTVLPGRYGVGNPESAVKWAASLVSDADSRYERWISGWAFSGQWCLLQATPRVLRTPMM